MTLRSSATTSRRNRTRRLKTLGRLAFRSRAAVSRPCSRFDCVALAAAADNLGRVGLGRLSLVAARLRRDLAGGGATFTPRCGGDRTRQRPRASPPAPARGPRSRHPPLAKASMQGRQDLNLQPAVLETAALPIELRPCDGPSAAAGRRDSAARRPQCTTRDRGPVVPARSYGTCEPAPVDAALRPRARTQMLERDGVCENAGPWQRPDVHPWTSLPPPPIAASPPASAASPSPPPSRWTPRRRRSRPRAAPVIGFGAGEPDFPTPAADRRGRRRRLLATRRTTATRPRPACPSCARRSRPRPPRDSGYAGRGQRRCSITNGGKQAVYKAFATLLDPGDEVLLPAPYWTTYPEAITLAGGVPVQVVTDESTGYLVTVEQLEAARTAAHQGAAVRARRPTRPARSTRREQVEAIGRWAAEHGIWVVTDEIYEHLVYDGAEHVSMPVLVPELADTLHRAQRRGQDLRDDRLAGGLDDRPGRRGQGRREPAVAPHSNVCNVSQRAALAAVSGTRRTRSCEMRDGLRPPPPTIVELLVGDPRRRVPDAAAARSTPTRRSRALLGRELRGERPETSRRAGRADPGARRGRGGARRGVRDPRLLPALLRAGRRGPGHRRRPDGRPPPRSPRTLRATMSEGASWR